MATPINAPVAGEIWHLSIEDLFQPVQEAPRLGGDGPYVINLSVSTAPISLPTKSFTTRHDVHVYQIQVTEDGRTRFRLRLGPFLTEDEADTILAEVRDTYPGALTATASGSDLRVAESMRAKAKQRQASQKAADKSADKAADKAVIEEWISQKAVVPKNVVSPSPVPQDPLPQNSAPHQAPLNIIEAAVKVELAQVDAEISIDIAWPTPELTVPPVAPAPTVKAAAPIAAATAPTVKAAAPIAAAAAPIVKASAPIAAAPAPTVKAAAPIAAAPAPIGKAPDSPVVQAAPPAVKPTLPAAKELPTAAPPVAATATPVSPALTVTAWALPELDIPFPVAPKHAAATIAPPRTAPVPERVEQTFATLSLVDDTPVLTEVVVPRRTPPKNAVQKPVAAVPVVADRVIPQAKTATAPAASAPESKKPAPPPISAPAPITASAPIAAPVANAAPAARSGAKVAAAVTAAPVIKAAPVANVPTAVQVRVPANPMPSKSGAPPAPLKPPVMPQSNVTPRKAGVPTHSTATANPVASKLTSLQHVVVATAPVHLPRAVKKLDEPLADLESTQTVRALTPKELEDPNSRWFVIQLALADHAFDPEGVPNLDLFREYRLYSVAGLDQGRVVHALRLGFFKEEIGAVAVASYLATYWDKPTIKRVSVAERERFSHHRVEGRKDVGATGKHSVIEITDELVARRRRATQALSSNEIPNRPLEH